MSKTKFFALEEFRQRVPFLPAFLCRTLLDTLYTSSLILSTILLFMQQIFTVCCVPSTAPWGQREQGNITAAEVQRGYRMWPRSLKGQ